MSMEPGVVKGVTSEESDVEQYELENGGVDNKNKGKAIQLESSYDDESYPGSSPVSNSLLDPDSLIYEDDADYNDDGYNDDDYNEDEYGYAMEEDADSYSMYQDLIDAKDLPTGVEVPMEWFPGSDDKETAKASGSSKPSVAENGKSYASGSSPKKPAKGTGIHSPFFNTDVPTPVAQPWKAKSGGVTPNSAFALPHGYGSSHLQPQTPDTAMGEAPVPAPAPVPKPQTGHKSNRAKVDEVLAATDTSRVKRDVQDYLGKYLFFKRFDVLEDSTGHHYANKGTSSKNHTKEWVRRIQEEWRILEHDLPEMIFVRAYENRMDLMRAVIIGAQETPYHDGLFFFDIFFPDTYPSVPPSVNYQSGGLRINPNLYNCGKVCLSLLGTWSGSLREKWIPNDSTMLQVLVSIQGLILNQKPYFNEPGYETSAGSIHGEASSKAYSENTFLLSLKTMVYNMRRPPKYFEDFAYGHFYGCANDVLKACAAYRNGAPMASKVKGNVEDVKECEGSCSAKFRSEMTTLVETVLLPEFILLGVQGLEPEKEKEKPAETNNVAESSTQTRSRSKRDRGSSS